MGHLKLFFITLLGLCLVMCSPDDEEGPGPIAPGPETADTLKVSPVVFEPDEVPYQNLSDYHFFEGDIAALEPALGLIPYDLITSLFSDYAKKKRFIWMAEGSSAAYDSDQKVLNFADGTVLIKNFYYDDVLPDLSRRIIETRLLYRIDGAWHFAEYIWNDEQTDAILDLSGGYTPVSWMQGGEEKTVNYRIPSEVECLTCHKSGTTAIPLGPKPQNLDRDFDYVDGVKNQLYKWAEAGYLEGSFPSEINRLAAWDDPNELLEERVRSYLDVNCSSCHLEGSHCDYRPLRLAWNESADISNMGVCVEPDEIINPSLLYIVLPGNTERSVLHYRIASTEEAERMPLLGRTLVHKEALALITDYINSITETCE
jgi:uncharacterized repeat protein (TIGR03806 family)